MFLKTAFLSANPRSDTDFWSFLETESRFYSGPVRHRSQILRLRMLPKGERVHDRLTQAHTNRQQSKRWVTAHV